MVSLFVVTITLVLTNVASALTTSIDLGTADDFAVLAGSGITNTGATEITGSVGTFPTITEIGFGSITLNGIDNAGDSVTQGAKTDLVTAYNDLVGRVPVTTVPVELGGTIKKTGVYNTSSGTFALTGTLTLDAENDPDAVFIFKTNTTLTTASGSNIVLANGAQACNVFWQVGSSATLGTNSNFKGNILALTSITLTTGANVNGRILARNGAVTMDSNEISVAICDVTPAQSGSNTQNGSSTPTPSPSPSLTPTPSPTATVTPQPSIVVTEVVSVTPPVRTATNRLTLPNTNGAESNKQLFPWNIVILALTSITIYSGVFAFIKRNNR